MANKQPKIIVSITLLVIIVAAIVLYFVFRPTPEAPDYSNPVTINTKGQPTIGQDNAPVHIVAFEDLKCIACKMFNNTVYPQIKKKYIDTGIAKYTYINLAFIEGSQPAGNAARCLYMQNKTFFFPFVEYIYHNQPPETEDWATVSKLLLFAQKAVPTANMNKLSQCIISGRYNKFLQDNLKMASKLMNDKIATPAIYINGIKLNSFDMNNVDQLVEYAKNHPQP